MNFEAISTSAIYLDGSTGIQCVLKLKEEQEPMIPNDFGLLPTFTPEIGTRTWIQKL